MKKNIKIFIVFFIIFCFRIDLFAVAETSLAYTQNAVGGRETGMGETGVASVNTAFATYYNPAALGQYPLSSSWKTTSLSDSIDIIDAVFPYKDVANIAYVLTKNKGLLRWDGKNFYDYEMYNFIGNESIDSVISKWVDPLSYYGDVKSSILQFNGYDSTFLLDDIWSLMLPYKDVFNSKLTHITTDNNGVVYLYSEKIILKYSNYGWNRYSSSNGIDGKILKVIARGRSAYVLTDLGLYKLNYLGKVEYLGSQALKSLGKIVDFNIYKDSMFVVKSGKNDVIFLNPYELKSLKNVKVRTDSILFAVDSLKIKKIPSNYNVISKILLKEIKDSCLKDAKNIVLKNDSVSIIKVSDLDSLIDSNSVLKKEKFLNMEVLSIKSKKTGCVNFYKSDSVINILKPINDFMNKKLLKYKIVKSNNPKKYFDKKRKVELKNIVDKKILSLNKIFYNDTLNDISVCDSAVAIAGNKGFYIFYPEKLKSKRFKFNANIKKIVEFSDEKYVIATDKSIFEYKKGAWSLIDKSNEKYGPILFTGRARLIFKKDEVKIKMKSPIRIGFSFHRVMPNVSSNLYKSYLSMIYPKIPIGTLGFNLSYMSYGVMDHTDEKGNFVGKFSSYDLNVGAFWGVSFIKDNSFGVGFRGVYSKLTSSGLFVSNQRAKPATSWLLDLAYLLKKDSYSFGLAVQGIGPKLYYVDDNQADPAPTIIKLGGAYNINNSSDFDVVLTSDLLRNYYTTTSYSWEIDSLTNKEYKVYYHGNDRLKKEYDAIEKHLGIEVTYSKILSLRGGYVVDTEGSRKFATFGVGFKLYNISSSIRQMNIDGSLIEGFKDSDGDKNVLTNSFRISAEALF